MDYKPNSCGKEKQYPFTKILNRDCDSNFGSFFALFNIVQFFSCFACLILKQLLLVGPQVVFHFNLHRSRSLRCRPYAEGGVKVCGDAVLRYFWRGLAEIFISTCSISVLLGYAVCGIKKVWVTVIGNRKVSAVLRFH